MEEYREFHPVTKLLPPLRGTAFQELAADIRKNGLREPILVDAEGSRKPTNGGAGEKNWLQICNQFHAAGLRARLWFGSTSRPASFTMLTSPRLLEHGVREVITGDRDFARFPGLTIFNPFDGVDYH